MRKTIVLVGLMLLVSGAAMAQDAPKAEFAGTYTFIRTFGTNCNGGGASGAGYFKEYFGVEGDFSYCHASGGGSAETYLVGPKLAFRSSGKVDPFAHVLFGGMHVTGLSTFALAFGGGFDYKALPHVAIRVAQFDYIYTHFGGVRQNNFRYQGGIVIRWGGK
jgi:hypothetical protein